MTTRLTQPNSTRRAAATVEFAICLPLLFVLIFGSIEACNLIYLKQVLSEAAYEGALEAMKTSATEASVQARVEAVANARGINGVTVASGQDGVAIEDVDEGEMFYVRVQAQSSENTLGPSIFAGLGYIEAQVTGRKL